MPAAPGRPTGKLATNIVHFARTLRAAGLPIGPGQILRAVEAVEAVGLQKRDDFYWTLHSVFVNRRDQRAIFDQAFHVFWRNPQLLEKMMAMLLPQLGMPAEPDERSSSAGACRGAAAGPRRGAEGRGGRAARGRARRDHHLLRPRAAAACDFEKMSQDELDEAKRAIARMRLPMPMRPPGASPARRGTRVDMRATLRGALRSGGLIELRKREPRRRPPPLVILCDISGSMSRYTRIFLHFMHAVTNDRDRVHCFLFGTRLTNITRLLRHRDVDVALDGGRPVEDWSGGTRIGHCLPEFNAKWSRRVLGQGAVVLLITDGLDRDGRGAWSRRDGAAAQILPPPDLAEPALALRRL